jgi:hypothetical protein
MLVVSYASSQGAVRYCALAPPCASLIADVTAIPSVLDFCSLALLGTAARGLYTLNAHVHVVLGWMCRLLLCTAICSKSFHRLHDFIGLSCCCLSVQNVASWSDFLALIAECLHAVQSAFLAVCALQGAAAV